MGGGGGGQGGSERRIKVFVKIQKKTRKSAPRGTYTPGWCVIDFDL